MVGRNKPVAEIDVDEQLVRGLLLDQHRDLADLRLRLCASGWDNAMFRLGDEYAVRVPRREASAQNLLNEQKWLPVIERALPIPVPTAIRVGRPVPALGYPWSWTVSRWFEGDVLGSRCLDDPKGWALGLGSFLAALHVTSPPDAPTNPYRGCLLGDRAENFDRMLDEVSDHVDAGEVASAWSELVATPGWSGAPMWLHGDLHPLNIVVDGGGDLVAIIDFGDITGGDPSTDLAIAWMIFDAEHRSMLRSAALINGREVDDDTWTRAKGWALNFAIVYLANSADVPVLNEIGRTTLTNVLADIR